MCRRGTAPRATRSTITPLNPTVDDTPPPYSSIISSPIDESQRVSDGFVRPEAGVKYSLQSSASAEHSVPENVPTDGAQGGFNRAVRSPTMPDQHFGHSHNSVTQPPPPATDFPITGLEPPLSKRDIIQRDLHAFSAAMTGVLAGDRCSKGAAKRAARNLARDLYETKISHRERLPCHERRALKAEVKSVARELKREVRDAWRRAA